MIQATFLFELLWASILTLPLFILLLCIIFLLLITAFQRFQALPIRRWNFRIRYRALWIAGVIFAVCIASLPLFTRTITAYLFEIQAKSWQNHVFNRSSTLEFRKGIRHITGPFYMDPSEFNVVAQEPCRPVRILVFLPVRTLYYERKCRPFRWVQYDLGFSFRDGEFQWGDQPQPFWLTLSRTPILIKPDLQTANLMREASFSYVFVTQPPSVQPILHAEKRVRSWIHDLQVFLSWFMVMSIIVCRLFSHWRMNSTWRTIFTHFLFNGLAFVLMYPHLGDILSFPLFNSTAWHVGAYGPAGRSLSAFLFISIVIFEVILLSAIKIDKTSSLERSRFGKGVFLLVSVFLFSFPRLVRPAFAPFPLEWGELWSSTSLQLILRWGILLWLIGAGLLLGKLYVRYLRERTFLFGWFASILLLHFFLPNTTILILFTLLFLFAPLFYGNRMTYKPWFPLALAFIFVYIFHPIFHGFVIEQKKDFIQRDFRSLFNVKQSSAPTLIKSTLKELDMLFQERNIPVSLRTFPSPSLIWGRSTLGRARIASFLYFAFHSKDGILQNENLFSWQIPLPAIPPAREIQRSWTSISYTLPPPFPLHIRGYEKWFEEQQGWFRVVVGYWEELPWFIWDARHDVPEFPLPMSLTREMKKNLGQFLVGIWTRTGRALNPVSWSIVQPDLFRLFHFPRESWIVTRTWFGKTFSAFSLETRPYLIVIAYPTPTPYSFFIRIPAFMLFDILFLWGPFFLFPIVWRKKQKHTFRRTTLLWTSLALIVLGAFMMLFMVTFFLTDIRSLSHERMNQIQAQAKTVLEDYTTLADQARIDDTTLMWVSQTIRHDIDHYVRGKLNASSRRVLYQLGTLPVLQPPAAFGKKSIQIFTLNRTSDEFFVLPAEIDRMMLLARRSQLLNVGCTFVAIAFILGGVLAWRIGVILPRPISSISLRIQNIDPRLPEPIDLPGVYEEFEPILERLNSFIRSIQQYSVQLQNQLHLIETILEQMKDGVIVMNFENGELLYTNSRAGEFLAISGDLNKTGSTQKEEATHMYRSVLQRLETLLKQPIALNEYWTHTVHHEEKIIAFTYVPLSDIPIGILFIEDQTPVWKASQLETWQEIARHISHAVKNPLTPLRLTLQQIERLYENIKHESVRKKLTHYIQRLYALTDQLQNRVQQFSDFSKASVLLQQKQYFALFDLLQELKTLYETGEKMIIELHPPSEQVYIHGNRELFVRIFQNLFENALESGSETLRIVIKWEWRDREHIEIRFKNTGPPIPDDVLPHIFELYFTTKPYGSGLGLAFVKMYLNLHGGTIEAHNTPEGPEFYIVLPARKQGTETESEPSNSIEHWN